MGLPGKDWLPLREVASRWECSVDELLQHAQQGRLRISVLFQEPAWVEWHDLNSHSETVFEEGPLGLPAEAFRVLRPKGGFAPWTLRSPVLGANELWGKPVEGGPWIGDQPKIRLRDLIIMREEVERFERLHEIGGSGPGEDAPTGKNTSRPPLQQRHQEQEVLRVLRELGYEPKRLPPRTPGRPGPKSAARKHLTYSEKIFDKAWERLRSRGEISEVE